MILKEEEQAVLDLFPEKSLEELVPILEDSIEEGGPYTVEILRPLLEKIREEIAAGAEDGQGG